MTSIVASAVLMVGLCLLVAHDCFTSARAKPQSNKLKQTNSCLNVWSVSQMCMAVPASASSVDPKQELQDSTW